MWRMWTHSKGQKGSVFVMTSSSVLFSHSDIETDDINPKKTCRNNDAGLPPFSLLSTFFQLQRTAILFWALRAKHLLRFVCQSFSSPRGRYGSQERNRCRNVVERPAAGACFHYLKPPESREQKEMWMEKTYLSSGCEVQPAFWMIFFFFPSFFFLLHISSEAEAYCADCFHLGLFYKQKYLLQL